MIKRKPARHRTPRVVYEAAAQRASGKCELCGQLPDWRGLQMHHVNKKGMGGTNDPERLNKVMALCGKCHSSQHGITEK